MEGVTMATHAGEQDAGTNAGEVPASVSASRRPGVPASASPAAPAKIIVENFSASFGTTPALKSISLDIRPCERLAIIGPAGGGKTTFLRSLNRLNDLDRKFSCAGRILLDGEDIFAPDMDVPTLRRRIGMVYAVPIPLPWSIRDNIAYGLRLAGMSKARIDEQIESSLRHAVLWDEVKDRLDEPAHNLSGGQQQRMCLARVLALEPEVLVLDEPCSGLDPISTAKIEDALDTLRARYSVVLVTNNIMQASRASDRTAFFLMGELMEIGPTSQVFTKPTHPRTNDYITGHFG
jgi:phosphate transport system ATP-binding protein